jgi:hypothetical protein
MQIAIFLLSVLWVIGILFSIRKSVKKGGIIVPPIFSGTLCFALSIFAVLLLHVSPFHLIWAFFLSYIIGTVMLISPQITKLVMYAMIALAGTPTKERIIESKTQKRRKHKRK